MRLVDVQNQHQKLRIILSMYVRINNQSICDCFQFSHVVWRQKAGCKIVAIFKDYLLELRDIGSIDDKRLTTRKHEYKLIYKIILKKNCIDKITCLISSGL